MIKTYKLPFLSFLLGLFLWSFFSYADSPRSLLPKHALPKAKSGGLVIGNCDGETSVEIPGKKIGESLSPVEAKRAAHQLMNLWQAKHPGVKWRMISDENSPAIDPSKNEADVKNQQGTYSNFTPEDQKTWEIEQTKFIQKGKDIFHNAKLLKSTIAVSCDMCHPNAANTHPETYPKYQVQLQRVAMLRDMINWCIENPTRGKMLRDDDPSMRALEAYIISERKGTPLAPGKH